MRELAKYWLALDRSAPEAWFRAYKPKKFLIRFSLEDDGFSVESIVEKNFIGCQLCEAFVTKDQTIVNIPDVSNEQMMVRQDLAKGIGPNLLTDGDDH